MIRNRIRELTQNARCQTDLDKLVSRGIIKNLLAEFPNADPAEILYEWDSRKLNFKKMVTED